MSQNRLFFAANRCDFEFAFERCDGGELELFILVESFLSSTVIISNKSISASFESQNAVEALVDFTLGMSWSPSPPLEWSLLLELFRELELVRYLRWCWWPERGQIRGWHECLHQRTVASDHKFIV
ncbi:unnamed protein product [Rhodiola kirilowii]